MKEQSGMEKKHKRMTKEKRFYLITGLASAAALVAVVLTAVLVANEDAERMSFFDAINEIAKEWNTAK